MPTTDPARRQQPLSLTIHDQALRACIDVDAPLETIAEGFKFTEGPAWHPVEQHLTFSDILGNSIYRWTDADGLRDIRPNSHLANGNTYDRVGRLLSCHHATSRVTRVELDGTISVLADSFQGKALNSPNDIIVKSDGAIYFTDPLSGRERFVGIPRPSEIGFQGVYRIDPDNGRLTLLVDDMIKPNGLCFSPDEDRLFINDSTRRHIRVFNVTPGGTLTGGKVWAVTEGDGVGAPDGMKIDSAGILWCAAQGGIHLFNEDAVCLGIVQMPEQTANFAWGDADLRSLYITASSRLYRLRVPRPGRPLF